MKDQSEREKKKKEGFKKSTFVEKFEMIKSIRFKLSDRLCSIHKVVNILIKYLFLIKM